MPVVALLPPAASGLESAGRVPETSLPAAAAASKIALSRLWPTHGLGGAAVGGPARALSAFVSGSDDPR